MSAGELHTIQDGGLSATISTDGAELHSIRTAGGRELLWQAGPDWPRHAPVLFPIVGRLAGDRLLHDGAATRMTQHGFARDRAFTFIERDRSECRLVLEDDEQSRAIYPFGFRLEIAYGIDGSTLTVSYHLANPGHDVLPRLARRASGLRLAARAWPCRRRPRDPVRQRGAGADPTRHRGIAAARRRTEPGARPPAGADAVAVHR